MVTTGEARLTKPAFRKRVDVQRLVARHRSTVVQILGIAIAIGNRLDGLRSYFDEVKMRSLYPILESYCLFLG